MQTLIQLSADSGADSVVYGQKGKDAKLGINKQTTH